MIFDSSVPSIDLDTLEPGQVCKSEIDVDLGRTRSPIYIVTEKRRTGRFLTGWEVEVVVVAPNGSKTTEVINGGMKVRRPVS